MPTYTFRNKTTGEEFNKILSLSERESFLKENPDHEQLIVKAPPIGYLMSGVNGRTKPDDGFRQILKNIKKANPKGNIETF